MKSNLPKIFKYLFLLIFTLLFLGGVNLFGATRTASVSGNWNATATWGGQAVPTSGDDVIINNNVNVTVNVPAVCNGLTINAGNNSSILTISGSNSLTVNGAAIINGGTGNNDDKIIAVGGGTFSCASITIANTGHDGADSEVTLSSGTVNVAGDIVMNGNTLRNAIRFSGGGTLNLGGEITGGDFIASSGTVNYNRTGSQTIGNYTYNNLTLSGSGTKTFGYSTAISGILTINSGVIANLGSGLTHTANSISLGSLGQPAGSWGGTGSAAMYKVPMYFANGTGILNVSTSTFSCPNGSWTGLISSDWNTAINWCDGVVPTATTNVIINSGGNQPVIWAAAMCNNITMNAGSSLTLSGTNTFTVSGNWTNNGTFIPNSGTVIYNGGAQSTAGVNYFHLTLLNSGIKTLQPGTSTIGGNFTIDDATTTAVRALTIGGDVILNRGFSFASADFTHSVAGNWTRNGWGTFTPGGGTIQFAGNTSAINGTHADVQTFNTIQVSKSAGGVLSIGGSVTFLRVNGDLVITSGGFSPGTKPILISGNWTKNGGTFTPGTGIITMNGSGKTIGGTSSTTFNNLTINNNALGILLGNHQIVNGTLTLSNGLLKLGSYNLTLGATAPAIPNPFWTANMIVADGTGELRKIFTANGSFTFPVGDSSDGSADLSPITLNFTSGSYAAGAYAAVRVTDAKHPQNPSTSNYLTRYWTVAQSGISGFTCTVTGTYNYGPDIIGQEYLQSGALFTGSLPWIEYPALSANTLTATGVTSFGDFTGIENSTLVTGAITGSPFCSGAAVSVPFSLIGSQTSGNVFTAQLSDASGSFASPVAIGTLTSTTSGTISATIPVGTSPGTGYRIRVVSSNPVKIGTDNGNDLIVLLTMVPTTNGAFICIGSSALLSASGAVDGDRYRWYDAPTGGNLLKTSTNNIDNTYTTGTLGATTNYWVSILNAGSCETSRTQVTASYPLASTDNPSDEGADLWIGHVYDGIGFNTFFGRYSETETFNQNFGGNTNCFVIVSNSVDRSIYSETYSVRYRMNSTRKGLYVVDLGSDDGSRLTVDGTVINSNWTDHALDSRPRVLMNLNGNSSLVYEFYENGGGNQVVFQNLTPVLANTLSTHTTQTICLGNSGSAIGGDVYGTLPTGITLSGTGYQWTYSTSPGGARTIISGATGATYTPGSLEPPFNIPGVYYLFRNAILSSANNVSPNPYVATNESNAAILSVYALQTANAGSPFTKTCRINPTGRAIGEVNDATATYSWSPSTGLSSTTVSNPMANPTVTTTYTVTKTSIASGCTAQASVTVTVNTPATTVSAGSPFTKTCIANPTGRAIGEVNDATATYSWSPSTGLSSVTVSNPTANPAVTTTYTVTKTNTVTGCSAQASVIVTVNTTLPTVSAGSPFTKTCVTNPLGKTIGEANDATATYLWTPATGLSSATVSNPMANPTTSTTYTVTKTSIASGCTVQASVTVTVNTFAPTVSAGSAFTKTCITNPTGRTIGEVNDATATYLWSPSAGLSSVTASNPTANPAVTTTYTVTKTNIVSGCTAQASVIVTVNNTAPTVSITGSASICAGQTTTLAPTSGGTWTSSNSGLATVTNLGVVTGVAAGSPTFTFTQTATGCSNTTSAVTVEAVVSAAGPITGLLAIAQGQTNVPYSVAPIFGATSYVWAFTGTGATINGTGSNVTISFSANSSPGILTVYGTNECGNGPVSPGFSIAIASPPGSIAINRQYPENNYTPAQLVQNVLLQGCLTANNISFTGASTQIGHFTKGSSSFPINEGIILSTGNVADAEGPNKDYNTFTVHSTAAQSSYFSNSYDVAILEFDFVPAGNTMEFNYVFASEEFAEYVMSAQNDAFAFLLSGPGITGEKNIALIPGTTDEVSINTVHGPGYQLATNYPANLRDALNYPTTFGHTWTQVNDNVNGFYTGSTSRYYYRISPTIDNSKPADNGAYYVDNGHFTNRYDLDQATGRRKIEWANGNGSSEMEFDGRTTFLTATHPVTACQTYHIKMVLVDRVDAKWDSGVLLEGKSFSSNEVQIQNLLEGISGDNSDMFEGCNNSYIRFSRAAGISHTEPLTFDLILSGTAQNGVDYVYTNSGGTIIGDGTFPTVATIPIGQNSVEYYYKALSDGMIEGKETVIFQVDKSCPCDPSKSYFEKTVNIIDVPQIQSSSVSVIQCLSSGNPVAVITANMQDGLDPNDYQFSLDGGAYQSDNKFTLTSTQPDGSDIVGTIHTLTVRDGFSCNEVVENGIVIPPITPFLANAGSDISMCEGQSGIQLNGSGGIYYAWTSSPAHGINYLSATNIPNPRVSNTIVPGTYIFTLTSQDQPGADPVCQGTDNLVLTVSQSPEVTATANDYSICNSTSVQLNAFVTNGGSNLTYLWSPSANLSDATVSNPVYTPDVNAYVAQAFTVTVTSENGCPVSVNTPVIEVFPAPVITTVAILNANCGANNGWAQVSASSPGTSPVPPFTYSWNTIPVQTTATATNLVAGTYTVTVTDVAHGCSSTHQVTVGSFEDITPPTAVCRNISVTLDGTGNATITPAQINNGSTDNCTVAGSFVLSLDKTTFNSSNIGENTVILTVTDLANNSSTCTATVTVLYPTTCSITGSRTIYKESFGTGTVNGGYTISGGTSYNIVNQRMRVTTNVSTANFWLSRSINISSWTNMNVSVSVPAQSALDAGSDYIQLWYSVDGGSFVQFANNGRMTGNWTGTSCTNVPNGNTLQIKILSYQNGNTEWREFDDVTLTADPAMEAPANITNVSCNGGNNGAINLTVTKGLAPYTYFWTTSNGSGLVATAEDQTGLTAGTYNLVVTDANLVASEPFVFTITQPAVDMAINTALAVSDATLCNSGSGNVNLTITNSGNGIRYELKTIGGASLLPAVTAIGNGSNLDLILLPANMPVVTTTYKVVATSASGCSTADLTDQPTLTVITTPAPTGAVVQNFCSANSQKISNLSITGSNIKWYNALSGGIELSGITLLVDGTTYYATQTINGCESATRLAVTVNVSSTPTILSVTHSSICGAGTATLHASSSAGVITWYNASTGGVAMGSGPAFTTPIINATTSFWVDATNLGCTTSIRSQVYATVNVSPEITLGSSLVACMGSTSVNLSYSLPLGNPSRYSINFDLTAENAGFMDVTNGVLPASPIVLSIPGTVPAGVYNATLRVRNLATGCISNEYPITITLNDNPAITLQPSNPTAICEGAGTFLLSVAATGGGLTYQWYVDGTTVLSELAPYSGVNSSTLAITDPEVILNGKQYTVKVFGDCGSQVTSNAAILTVNAKPSLPLGSENQSFCASENPTVSDLAVEGSNIIWYNSLTAGTVIPAATPLVDATTYYASQTVTGCESNRLAVSVTITPLPAATISYAGSPFCQTVLTPQSVTLEGTGGYTGGSYAASPAGLSLDPLTGAINPSASAAGSYTVTYTIASSGGCAVVTATTGVTITTLPVATFVYGGSPYCKNAADPSPSFSGGGIAGTFSSTEGLVFVNASTGQVDLAASAAGTYTVTNTIAAAGGCAQVTGSAEITITTLPVATFVYGGSPYCKNAADPIPSFSGGGVAGTFSSTEGLVFANASMGQVDLAASVAGTYTVYNTIVAAGGCAQVTGSAEITITTLPVATVSYPGTPFCSNAGVQSVSIIGTGAYTGGTYSAPAGLSINSLTGDIDPGTSEAGSYLVTYSIAATGGCFVQTATTSVTITALPAATILYAGTPFCQTVLTAQSVTLVGTGGYTGGSYAASPAGLSLDPVSGAINPSASEAGSYTVTYTIASSVGCSVVTATTGVTITTLPVATFVYGGSPYCKNAADPSPSFSGGGIAGTFSSTEGLVFVNASTGQVDLAASVAGTYTVTNTIAAAGGCAQVTATASITITTLPVASISYPRTPLCSNAGVQSVSINGTGAYTGGTYSAPGGLSINSLTGDIDPATSAAGSYLVTYTIAATGGCSGQTATTLVTITPLPSATILYPGTPFCQTVLTARPVTLAGTGGYTGGSYAASPAGLSLDHLTGAINPSASAAGSYTVTYTIASTGGCAVVTATTSVTIHRDGSWTGAINQDWNNPGNWACNQLPTITTNVLIANGKPNYPVLSSGNTGSTKDITIENSTSLTVTDNTLQIAGTISNGGTFTATQGTIKITGSVSQAIGANVFTANTIMNLTIDNAAGVTLQGPLQVTGIVLAQNGNLFSGGNLTLVSTSAQTALIDGTGAGEVLGNVIMERYLASAFGYKYLSSPFQSATVSELATEVNLLAAFPTFYGYNEDNSIDTSGVTVYTSGWSKYTNPGNILVPLSGYAANLGPDPAATPITANMTGVVNNGYLQTALYNHDRKYTKGFNLVGNPYPSPIDWNASGWTKINIDNALYFFNASGSQYAGAYSSYVNGVSSGNADNTIPAMQGFFVHVSDGTYPVAGSLGLTNTVRVNNLNPIFKRAELDPRTILRFTANFETKDAIDDEAVIYFDNTANLSFDKERDALKMINTDLMVPNLYTLTAESRQLSINAMPFPEELTARIPLGITTYTDGWVTFKAYDLHQLPAHLNIYLADAETGKFQDLNQLPNHRFYLNSGEHNQRFSLVFSLTELATATAGEIFTLSRSGDFLRVKINLPFNTRGEMMVTNILGQVILRRAVSENETVDISQKVSTGVYVITLQSGKLTHSEKVIMRKDYE